MLYFRGDAPSTNASCQTATRFFVAWLKIGRGGNEPPTRVARN
jgi:hypothetical protein